MTGVASIQGLGGNDSITGSHGADTILGGNGIDRIDGNGGADIVSGNAGNDNFFVGASTPAGLLTISDFDGNGNDVLHLTGFSFGSANPAALIDAQRLAALTAATSFAGEAATIDLAGLCSEPGQTGHP